MSELVKEPSDEEFSKLLDSRAPNRLQLPDALPEHGANASLLGSDEFPVDAPVAPATPVSPEDGLVPEPAPTPVVPATPVDPKYAGKTTEELIEMHRNAEQLIGSQGQKLGEVNQLRDELNQLKGVIAERTPQQAPLTQETVDWVEESVIGNPQGTMKWVEENQPALKERALQTWAAIDPFAAGAYRTEQLIRENDAKWEQRLASVEAPFRATQNDTQLERAYTAVSNSLPGFNDVAEDLPALLEANPEFKIALVNGDPAVKQRTLENLARIALFEKAMKEAQPGDVVEPVVEVPAVDPRVAASVANGSSGSEHGGEAPTQAEQLKASMLTSGPTSIREELARSRANAR
jgi:uncharacterized phage infection (PIP) family protein YhgE